MHQLIQDLKTGNTLLEEIPALQVRAGCVLIQTIIKHIITVNTGVIRPK